MSGRTRFAPAAGRVGCHVCPGAGRRRYRSTGPVPVARHVWAPAAGQLCSTPGPLRRKSVPAAAACGSATAGGRRCRERVRSRPIRHLRGLGRGPTAAFAASRARLPRSAHLGHGEAILGDAAREFRRRWPMRSAQTPNKSTKYRLDPGALPAYLRSQEIGADENGFVKPISMTGQSSSKFICITQLATMLGDSATENMVRASRERSPKEYRMTCFSRFFLGCFAIALLSLSGCATGTAFDRYPGVAAAFGASKSEGASSGSASAKVVTRNPDWDSQSWAHGQQ